MSDWTAGYVSELAYTYGYYQELNPNRVDFCMLKAGLKPPKITNALELGFGQGISINIHSAASDVSWTGTDFNPSQASFASTLNADSDGTALITDASFEEFLAQSTTAQFQYIGLHGIWSWISDKNREAVVEIIQNKLAVGGVVYISYNTMPGWASVSPLRYLMAQHASELNGAGFGISKRIEDALEFSEKLLDLNPQYLLANPNVRERIEGFQKADRRYLAHEFFNKDWQPMHFGEIAAVLSAAKLEFAASAAFPDNVDEMNFNAEQRQFLRDIPDSTLRETCKDFILNRQFRKDLWVKGPVQLSQPELQKLIRSIRIVLPIPSSQVSLETTGGLGKVSMEASIYQPIIDFLADNKIKNIGEVVDHFQTGDGEANIKILPGQILQAVSILLSSEQLVLAQSDDTVNKVRGSSQKINTVLEEKALNGEVIPYLASPITGGGVHASRFEILFVRAMNEGATTPKDLAASAWAVLSAHGHKVLREGSTLESDEENLNELTLRATEFYEKRLTTFQTLEII